MFTICLQIRDTGETLKYSLRNEEVVGNISVSMSQ